MDPWGDGLMCAPMAGDGWRVRHDTIKMVLFHLCQWAGLAVKVEAYNLFSGLIRQAGLARLEAGRKQQGLIPDLKLTIPPEGRGGGGQVVQMLKS